MANLGEWVLNHFEFLFVAKAVKDSMGNGVWLIGGAEPIPAKSRSRIFQSRAN
jgi:hypothetical protein